MSQDACILCDKPATRRKPDPDRDVFEFDCRDCGRYAAGQAKILLWPTLSEAERRAQRALVKDENAKGIRPLL